MITDGSRVPLGRRAWIGDGRHGASLAPDGTIDWYCPKGLTGTPGLWRLLDDTGAAVRVGPRRDQARARRHLPAALLRYRPGTNVADNLMEGAAGQRLLVTDFMPWPGPGQEVTGRIVRLLKAVSGPVEVEVEVEAGPARSPFGPRRVTVAGGRLVAGPVAVTCAAPFEPAPSGPDGERWRALIALDAGEESVVTVTAARPGSAPPEPTGTDEAHQLLEVTEGAWRSWLGPLHHGGPYRPEVERALLAVRSLTGPGGAPAGAGTTSLPRRVGSERSADNRWVHLRDVATAVGVFASLGLAEDAEAAETWLRHTISTAHLPWPGWFDQDGQPVPEAAELALTGWRRSGPVWAGRPPERPDAGLVGAVVGAVGASMTGPGGRPGDPGPLSAAFAALADATDDAADRWRSPDTGRWEIDRPRRLYVAGRLEAWTAMDRMARLARAANPLDLKAAGWQQEGRDLFSWLERHGPASDGGLRMDGDPAGGDEADAALLEVAGRGPWPPSHPIVQATVDRVLERLGSGPLLHRYADRVADELAGPDRPDVEASFMAVAALGRLGRWDEAHERMEAVTGLLGRDGPGLPAATADPVSGEIGGDLPCTAAALALLDAAGALERGPR